MKGRIYTIHYGQDTSVLQNFINSISKNLGKTLDLVIINNQTEIDLSEFSGEFITILNSPYNLGYFGAAKFGMDKISFEYLDFIIICNNDLEIKSPDFFEILEGKLKIYDIIAPSTISLDGIEQNPHRERKPSAFRKFYYRIYFLSFSIAWLLDKIIMFKKNFTNSAKVIQKERLIYSPHGAFFIFNSSYFKSGGFIDTGNLLYGEEDSVAGQAEKLGLKIGFVPALKVLHYESRSTGKGVSPSKFKYLKQSYHYILEKYPSIYA